MPFHNGAYYPYSSLTQGTHSSDGIPSVLNSPTSHAASAPSMTPSSGASTFLPFKFRPRRESVDWRRINAVDIELVMSQLDVDALQEHISTVTFCSLDGERCQRCQSPVDPALVKLLQLSQLMVEWLLHCQDLLSLNLRAAEERLVAASLEREQLQAQSRKQEEKMKELTAELKHRRKVIRTQQSLFAPRISSSHKCPHCEKYFLNNSFLQNHLQRRHPDEFQTQLQSDEEKKSQMASLKQEISSLKQQVVQQQQDLQAKIAEEKEQQHLHRELQRELDRFKSEEMARMDRMIEDSRDGMRREIKFLCNQNFQALSEVSQPSRTKTPSPVREPERDVDRYQEMHLQAIQKLELQMKKQDRKWESKLQEIKSEHESEKNQLLKELSQVQSLVEEQQELSRKLQEKEQTIRAQREQIRTISSNPPIRVVEVPVAAETAAQKPKPKRVVLEEPVSALKLDPIQELSEEEKDSGSISEKRPAVIKSEPAPARKPKLRTGARRKSPDIKEIRPALELSLTKKLEGLGVRGDQSGLKNKELMSLLAGLSSTRDAAVKKLPDYWSCREEIASDADQRLRARWRGTQPAPEPQSRSKQPVQVMQIRPRSSSLPSRSSQVASSGATAKQPKVPQPVPRTKPTVQPKTSTPKNKTAVRIVSSRTPPFSSDEESEEETDSEEEPPQKSKLPASRLFQATPVQITASKTGPVQSKSAAAFQSSSKQSAGAAIQTAVTKMESEEEDDDWSDVSELQEIDPKQMQGFKDLNGNMNKKRSDKVQISDLARKMEQQFAERAVKKPAGGVSVLPGRRDEVQELLITDVEDRQEVTKPTLRGSGPLRKSLDSPSTSVWGTSTGKGPSSGVTEAGTGSTLKSSLCSLSDISDSEY
ncbi:cilium assembly protein DZIP1 isoform X1 [Nothobranchius furzeri]|uniref:DAZ interacting protein 1 n=2 Tax=Nothobranchius furzeri TaxID=105023 RepID=A0A1A8AJJ6_NOTFU|nr:transcript variant X1 [Nothobranchius furzeri]